MRTLTDRARFLTAGGTPDSPGITAPPSDSGTLGPQVPADRLTVTVRVGASLFDDRYGLAVRRPRRLTSMPSFPDDDIDAAWCHGDLSVQLCADNTDTVLHALRDIARHTRGGMQVRWRMDGFVSPSRPSGAPRNHLGFKGGIANPDVTDGREMDHLVWVGPDSGEPDWAVGGSYQVVRLIRMLVEFRDREGSGGGGRRPAGGGGDPRVEDGDGVGDDAPARDLGDAQGGQDSAGPWPVPRAGLGSNRTDVGHRGRSAAAG